MTEATAIEEIPKEHRGLSFALDFGPLLIFFLVYKFGAPEGSPITAAIYGTIAFMIAIVIAMIVSKWKLGKVSPMMWMSAILILGFGALTIYFNDPRFIQHKPTIIYAGFALILFGGLLRGKAMLKSLLQAAFEGLTDEGWLKLSRNWAIFFAAMADQRGDGCDNEFRLVANRKGLGRARGIIPVCDGQYTDADAIWLLGRRKAAP